MRCVIRLESRDIQGIGVHLIFLRKAILEKSHMKVIKCLTTSHLWK